MGTAHFMSPEQAASEPIDGRSDIYSLGVVGYLAVSGRLPFESSNLPALLLRQATETPPSVMRAAPGLPPALGAAIDRCLARDPADRFADGEALAAALVPAADDASCAATDAARLAWREQPGDARLPRGVRPVLGATIANLVEHVPAGWLGSPERTRGRRAPRDARVASAAADGRAST